MPADPNDPKYNPRIYPLPILTGQPEGNYQNVGLIDAFGMCEGDMRQALNNAMDGLIERARRLDAEMIVGFRYEITTEVTNGIHGHLAQVADYTILAYGNAVRVAE